MSVEFEVAFEALTGVLRKHSGDFTVQADTATEYSVVGKRASPFPQHKGQPMWFGAVRVGKAYVSFHLMPLYMNPALVKMISTALKKRMQGKTCFNFTRIPEPELLRELEQLTAATMGDWTAKQWL